MAFLRAAVAAAIALAASASSAPAQELASILSTFVDEEDGYLDASDFLARGGFIPIPIIVTEPAVGGGFGLAGYFVRAPSPGSDLPPTRTIVGAVKTGNESRGGGIMRSGTVAGGDIFYLAALGAGTINLDVYPFGGDTPVRYTNPSRFAILQARHRIGDSGWSAGASAVYRRSDVSIVSERFPILNGLSRETTLTALGFDLHYDDRDNPLTPRNGANALLSLRGYDSAWGSDADFDSAKLFGSAFHTRGAWTLGGRVKGEAVSGDAPFFMEPSVDLRGVPFGRYQGGRTVSAEVELLRQIHPRWAVLGFAGYGKAFAAESAIFDADESAVAGGAGFRYRIARKLGLDVGLDVARGPEDTIVYIQFGHAWSRDMD